jgi:N-acetylneuraminate synthase/sialic acid synthase
MKITDTRAIGPGEACFLVAEIGNNHQGCVEIAKEMVLRAAWAGADAVKFQKRDVNSLLTDSGLRAPYGGPNSFGPTYGEHRKRLELDFLELAEVKTVAEDKGLVFFASVWDKPSLEGMCSLGAGPIKIPSADLTNIPLLREAAGNGIPIILSTGMSTLEEIDRAVEEILRRHSRLALLQCNSSYPCPDGETGVAVMELLKRRYGLPVGYSGHERGLGPSLAAASLGASIIERHFTLDKNMRGTDHPASLTPEEFKSLAETVRSIEASLAKDVKSVSPAERKTALKLRKSIVFARDLPAGHVLAERDLTAKCPGDGVSPLEWDKVIGARLITPATRDGRFQWDMVEASGAEELSRAAT